jgi:hypothetical protein
VPRGRPVVLDLADPPLAPDVALPFAVVRRDDFADDPPELAEDLF